MSIVNYFTWLGSPLAAALLLSYGAGLALAYFHKRRWPVIDKR